MEVHRRLRGQRDCSVLQRLENPLDGVKPQHRQSCRDPEPDTIARRNRLECGTANGEILLMIFGVWWQAVRGSKMNPKPRAPRPRYKSHAVDIKAQTRRAFEASLPFCFKACECLSKHAMATILSIPSSWVRSSGTWYLPAKLNLAGFERHGIGGDVS
jgi:hypothetical protein